MDSRFHANSWHGQCNDWWLSDGPVTVTTHFLNLNHVEINN